MFILTLFLFATLARAIYITLPVNGTSPVYVVGSNVTISWTYVITDPSNFRLLLERAQPASILYDTITPVVSTSANQYTFALPKDLSMEAEYRFDFINATSGFIYAQSTYFTLAENEAAAVAKASEKLNHTSTSTVSTSRGTVVPGLITTKWISPVPTGTIQTVLPGTSSGPVSSSSSSSSSSVSTTATSPPTATPSSGAYTLAPPLALLGCALVALMF